MVQKKKRGGVCFLHICLFLYAFLLSGRVGRPTPHRTRAPLGGAGQGGQRVALQGGENGGGDLGHYRLLPLHLHPRLFSHWKSRRKRVQPKRGDKATVLLWQIRVGRFRRVFLELGKRHSQSSKKL